MMGRIKLANEQRDEAMTKLQRMEKFHEECVFRFNIKFNVFLKCLHSILDNIGYFIILLFNMIINIII